MEHLFGSWNPTIDDVLASGDHIYVLRDGTVQARTVDGDRVASMALPDGYHASTLAEAEGGGCVVCSERVLYFMDGARTRTVTLSGIGRYDLGADQLLWAQGDGFAVIHNRLGFRESPLSVETFAATGVHRGTHQPSRWLGFGDDPMARGLTAGYMPAIASAGDRAWALNLAPLRLHSFDKGFEIEGSFSVCGSQLVAQALKFERVLVTVYMAGGVLALPFAVPDGQFLQYLSGALLTVLVLISLHQALRRTREMAWRRGLARPWHPWLLAYLLPWAVVLILLIRLLRYLPMPTLPRELIEPLPPEPVPEAPS